AYLNFDCFFWNHRLLAGIESLHRKGSGVVRDTFLGLFLPDGQKETLRARYKSHGRSHLGVFDLKFFLQRRVSWPYHLQSARVCSGSCYLLQEVSEYFLVCRFDRLLSLGILSDYSRLLARGQQL